MRAAQNRSLYILSLYFVLSLFLWFLDSRNLLSFVKNVTFRATAPVESSLYGFRLAVSSPFSWFDSRISNTERVKSLEEEKNKLAAQVVTIKQLQEENEAMKKLLSANLSPSWHFSPLSVVSTSAGTIYLTGDGPISNGVSVVVIPEVENPKSGVLVGKVISSEGKRYVVNMPIHVDSKTPVEVRDQNTLDRKASGIVVGKGGKMLLDQVLTNEVVGEGYLVVTAGDESTPPGLLVGSISRVLPVKEGAWQQAEVLPALNYDALRKVFAITKF